MQRLLTNGPDAFSHIFLAAVTTSGFYRWVIGNYLTDYLDLSTYITTNNPDCILAITRKGINCLQDLKLIFKSFQRKGFNV